MDLPVMYKNKECTIAAVANRRWNLVRIQEEINKCILLCANCHRKLHHFGKFTFKNTFKKRQGWRIKHYFKKKRFKALFLYLSFCWHEPFDVFITPVYSKDMKALREYDYDIRKIFTENPITTKEDVEPFFKTVNIAKTNTNPEEFRTTWT